MAEKKQKLTEEQKEQLKQLQMMLQQGAKMQAGGAPGAMPAGIPGMTPKRPPIYTLKGFLIHMLTSMQKSVKFIDQFINFVINKKTKDTNDVISSSRSPILFGFWIIMIFVVLGSIWAGTAPLDSAAVAIGTVVSDSKKRIINHSEGGILKKIYVNIGDEVHPGDKLLEFDDTRVRTEYESVLSQYRNALATESRLLAEINDLEQVVYPEFLTAKKNDPEVSKIIETNDSLFLSKQESITTEGAALKERVKQLRNQIAGLGAKREAFVKTLEVTQDRLEATKKLYDKGYAQKAHLLEFEDKEARILSEIAIIDTEVARTEQQISENEIQLINLKSKALANALGELKENQIKLPQLTEGYKDLGGRLERMVVVAHVDGIVNSIEYTTIGSTVQGLAPLMEISPKDDKLVIEAKIEPKSIDSIVVGLQSKIRFSAFKSRVSPIFLGEVKSISPDIIIPSPGKPLPDPKLQAGYYTAQIELDMDDFNKKATPRQLSLKPGMQAEVQIVTGERTLLKYLLDPVYDAMFKGFKER